MYTSKSDVYSFGVLLYEIFSRGGMPFAELQPAEVVNAVKAGHVLGRPLPLTPDAVVRLIRACTSMTAAQRPSAAAIRRQLQALLQHDAEPVNGCSETDTGLHAGGGTTTTSNDMDEESEL